MKFRKKRWCGGEDKRGEELRCYGSKSRREKQRREDKRCEEKDRTELVSCRIIKMHPLKSNSNCILLNKRDE